MVPKCVTKEVACCNTGCGESCGNTGACCQVASYHKHAMRGGHKHGHSSCGTSSCCESGCGCH
jgi:hypothetical protein